MPDKDKISELKEKLAAIEHERWADWQKWCHKVLREELRYNDMETNLEEILSRWDKQIATPYPELSEQEKQSDREQVERYWPLITQLLLEERNRAIKRIYENSMYGEDKTAKDVQERLEAALKEGQHETE